MVDGKEVFEASDNSFKGSELVSDLSREPTDLEIWKFTNKSRT